MLDLATVRCEQFAACLDQDFEIVSDRGLRGYRGWERIKTESELLHPSYPRNPRLKFQ
jgi:hypothetical protein